MIHNIYTLFALNIALGSLLGALGGLFGIGGGLIAVPVFLIVYGMEQQLAQGTALVLMIPTIAIGFYRYQQRNKIPIKSALIVGITAMCTTFFSAYGATIVDARTLHVAFSIFIALLGGYYLYALLRKGSGTASSFVLPQQYLFFIGIVVGATSGFFGIGGALVAVPLLVAFFGVTQTTAQGLGLAAVAPGAIVALFTYTKAGFVDWETGIPLGIGSMLCVSWGVALAHHLPERKLRILFCAGLIVLAVWMIATELYM